MKEVVECIGKNSNRLPQADFERLFKEECLKEGQQIISLVRAGDIMAATVINYV